LSKSVSIEASPAWLGDPLNLLLTGPCTTTDLGEEVAFQWATKPLVTIIFEKSHNPNSHDLNFIAMIIRDQSLYIGKAAEFLLQDLKSRNAGETDVGDPQLTFRLDDTWEVHFPDAIPDESEGLGVLVVFTGEFPKSVVILHDESWFDTDTGKWIPA
jgi:hypothetical protein